MTAESRKKFVLPCGRTLAASWAALRVNIAKSQNNILRMQEFAYRIRKIQNGHQAYGFRSGYYR